MRKNKTPEDVRTFEVPQFEWTRRGNASNNHLPDSDRGVEIHPNLLDSHRFNCLPVGAQLAMLKVWIRTQGYETVELDANNKNVAKLIEAGFVSQVVEAGATS